MRKKYLSGVFILTAALTVHAQLAITEIASSGSTNLGATLVAQRSDYWELSNFGTNTINLNGYSWNDNAGGLIGADSLPFLGLSIAPGESILFAETVSGVSTNEAQFRAWWGTNLASNVQIRFYTGNGLGSGGDGVRIWASGATLDADVVDSVDFGTAVRGSSFTYDTNTGLFSIFSTNGVNGAFKAVETDDVGSPGVHQGPVVLTIATNPVSQSVNPGDNAVFTVGVRGLPRPRFQWRFNGSDISGATLSAYTVTNVQTARTGLYSVVVFNGFQTATSAVATLLLNPDPSAPVVSSPPADQTIYIGQNATFTVIASGFPQPRYQWSRNGTAIGNATNNFYTISGATLTSTGVYSVVVTNTLGKVTNSATLYVTLRPNLVITEVCSSESTNGNSSGHNDWWELTNFDTFPVDLYHYQFDDGSALRAAAYTVTNHVIISPGESVIFVEAMGPSSFRRWWGTANLKPELQIVRYDGPNLGFSSAGDGLILWNPGAVDDNDFIAAAPFGIATAGFSFGYNPDTQSFGDLSVLGIYGAFRSFESDDIGSPGYLITPPEPRILSSKGGPTDYEITWFGFSNRTFSVEYKNTMTDGWLPLGSVVSTNYITTATVPAGGSPTGYRFLRMSLLP